MNVFELIDSLLDRLEMPYYEGQPEFERSPPEAFISYNVYDVPSLRGDGRERTTAFFLTLNIYTTGQNRKTRAVDADKALTALFTENGFTRRGGSFGLTDDFPRYYHRVIEFNFDDEGEYYNGDQN